MNWRDHIDRNPAVLGGKPKIKGTRIGVGHILERLGDGWSAEHLLEAYPSLTPEQVHACQAYAADIIQRTGGPTEDDHAQTIDAVIEEIHETRRRIAKRFAGDGHRITADARQRQHREGAPTWHPPAEKPSSGATDPSDQPR